MTVKLGKEVLNRKERKERRGKKRKTVTELVEVPFFTFLEPIEGINFWEK
jgi:hypothetical protein